MSNGVRRHYRARARAPYPNHLVGRGVFCLSEKGRSRFSDFPPVIGDDLFVQSLFSKEECETLDTFSTVVRPPATIRELIRVQSRVAAGNREHLQLYPDRAQQGSRSALVRAHLWPWQWLDLATFLFVVGMSRLLPRLRGNTGQRRWETTRPAQVGPSDEDHSMTTRHLGMPVSLLTWPELDHWAAAAVASHEAVTVCTIAPYQVHLWRTHPKYASALSKASIVLVDGNGVRLALAAAGVGTGGRMTGREVVKRIFEGATLKDARIAVVGSSPESQRVIAERRPDWLVLGGRYPGEPEPRLVEETIAALKVRSIQVVLVALGCPKQELWAEALALHHPAVYFSIGGAVDTVAGTRMSPPSTVERLGLEWAWRLAQDPTLAAHVMKAAEVMPYLLVKAVTERMNRSETTSQK